jgi:hypothetical protein
MIFFRSFVNTFSTSDNMMKHNGLTAEIQLNINKLGEMRILDPESKLVRLRLCVEKLTSNDYIVELINSLGSVSIEIAVQGLKSLNKLLAAFLYITSHYDIVNHLQGIIVCLNNLGINGIVDRLLYILNTEGIAAKAYSLVLKIIKKIIMVSNYLAELNSYSKTNELGLTKNLDNEINGLKEYTDNIIQKVVDKVGIFNGFESQTSNASLAMCLMISKRSANHFNVIFTQTNFFNMLLTKIDYILVSNNFTYELICEARKYIFYCLYLTEMISTNFNNEIYSTHYDLITMILSKLLQVAEGLKGIVFHLNDSFIQIYYLLFLGYLTKRTNFDDRSFIIKAQEVVTKNFTLLIRPYIFYIKNILLSKVKKDPLSLIVDNKVITVIESIVESNKEEDVLLSEFVEIIDIIIEEHKSSLLTSNVLKDIVQVIERLLKFHSPGIAIRMLKTLAEVKEPFIDIMIMESECVALTCKHLINYKTKQPFFFELYNISKPTYETIMIGNGVTFLTHMVCSEVIKAGSKFLRSFGVQNLNHLIDLFNSLYYLWDNEDSPEESLLFEKYKDLPGFNIAIATFDLIKLCNDNIVSLLTHGEFFSQAEMVYTYLDKQMKELEVKYTRIVELSEDTGAEDNNLEEFFIYTQNKEESEKQLWTNFRFAGDKVDWAYVSNSIEKHYENELMFYFLNERSKVYTRIKNNSDFIEILDQCVLDARIKKQPVYLKLYVDDKSKRIKYILTCIHCLRRYEQETDVESGDKTSPLCDFCKNMFLNQIVSNISQSSPTRLNSYYTK